METDKAREIVNHLQKQARLIALAGINGYGNSMLDAADFIESQRLALEEKDREIAQLTEGGERMYIIQQAEIERLQSRMKELEEFRRIAIQGWQQEIQEWCDDGEPEEIEDRKFAEKMIHEQMHIWHSKDLISQSQVKI